MEAHKARILKDFSGFRHAIATHGQDILEMDLSVVSAILGHVTDISKATRIYARGQLLTARREALEAWADWLDSLLWRPRIGPQVAPGIVREPKPKATRAASIAGAP